MVARRTERLDGLFTHVSLALGGEAGARLQILSKAEMNKSAIARTLRVHPHTVQKYSALESAPERKPLVRKTSTLTPYEDYILKRFTDECHNVTQIHKEIVEQGYSSVCQNVVCITQYLKKCERDGEPLPGSPPVLCAVQSKGILITRPEKRTKQETQTIERLKRAGQDVGNCSCLFEDFARLFRARASSRFTRSSKASPYREIPAVMDLHSITLTSYRERFRNSIMVSRSSSSRSRSSGHT